MMRRFAGVSAIAKPTPSSAAARVCIAVTTPINSPRMFSSGPPEFPGLIAAVVWIMSV